MEQSIIAKGGRRSRTWSIYHVGESHHSRSFAIATSFLQKLGFARVYRPCLVYVQSLVCLSPILSVQYFFSQSERQQPVAFKVKNARKQKT